MILHILPWEIGMKKKNIWWTCLSLSPTTWSRSGFVMFMSLSLGVCQKHHLDRGLQKDGNPLSLMMFIGWTYSKPFVGAGYKDLVFFWISRFLLFCAHVFFSTHVFCTRGKQIFFHGFRPDLQHIVAFGLNRHQKKDWGTFPFFVFLGEWSKTQSLGFVFFLRWFVLKDTTTMGIHHHLLFATIWGKIIFLHFPSIEQI